MKRTKYCAIMSDLPTFGKALLFYKDAQKELTTNDCPNTCIYIFQYELKNKCEYCEQDELLPSSERMGK